MLTHQLSKFPPLHTRNKCLQMRVQQSQKRKKIVFSVVLGKHAQNRCTATFLHRDTCHKKKKNKKERKQKERKSPQNWSLSKYNILIHTSQNGHYKAKKVHCVDAFYPEKI